VDWGESDDIQTRPKETYILLPVGKHNHLRVYLHFFINTTTLYIFADEK